MAEYIEREAAINEQKRFCGYLDNDMLYRLEIAMRRIPAADVREVKRGRWTYKEGGKLCADGFYCTACGTGFHVHVPYFAEFNFCPNCGADMREES